MKGDIKVEKQFKHRQRDINYGCK